MSLGTSATLPLLRLNLLRIHSIPWYKLLAFKTASKHAHVQIIQRGGMRERSLTDAFTHGLRLL